MDKKKKNILHNDVETIATLTIGGLGAVLLVGNGVSYTCQKLLDLAAKKAKTEQLPQREPLIITNASCPIKGAGKTLNTIDFKKAQQLYESKQEKPPVWVVFLIFVSAIYWHALRIALPVLHQINLCR